VDIVGFIEELLLSSGAAWVLWLLLFLSLGSVAVAIERWLAFRSRDADVRALTRELDGFLSRGAFDDAARTLGESRAAAARIAAAGLRLRDHGIAAAERGMASAVAAERSALEARLAFLATLGNNAPFVGLFGTVIGVILAFDALGGAVADPSASREVMGAIAEALVATAVGIAVALPAVAANNYFQRRIARLLGDAEVLSNLVLAYLGSDAVGGPAAAPRREAA
jgi:biopolymer transport protein ExbB